MHFSNFAQINFIRFVSIFVMLFASSHFAEAKALPSVGLNFGFGIGTITQAQANLFWNEWTGIDLSYDRIERSGGPPRVRMTSPIVSLRIQPFADSFFVSAGFGFERFEIVSPGELSDQESAPEAVTTISAATIVYESGWMWRTKIGLLIGFDLSLATTLGDWRQISHSLSDAVLENSSAEERVQKLTSATQATLRFARIGYAF